MHGELSEIDEELEIEPRSTAEPEIFIYTNLLDNYQRLTTLNPSTVESIARFLVDKTLTKGDEAIQINRHEMLPLSDSFIRVPSSMGLAYSMFDHTRLTTSMKNQLQWTMAMPTGLSSISAGISGDIRMVMSIESSHKLIAETPFTRSYAVTGVHFDMTLALPGRISVQADVRRFKLEKSWKFLGERIQIAHHAVVPYTAICKVGDFTPPILTDGAQKIVLANQPLTVWIFISLSHYIVHQLLSKSIYYLTCCIVFMLKAGAVYKQLFYVIQSEYRYGEDTLGLNLMLSHRGDIGASQKPVFNQDLFGSFLYYAIPSTLRYHECAITLDSGRSETDVISASISFGIAQYWQSYYIP